MTIYRVELDATYLGTNFDFIDFGEAMGFIGAALESGTKDGKRLSAAIRIVEQEVGLNE